MFTLTTALPVPYRRVVTYGMDVRNVSKTAQIYGSYGILVRRIISQRILHSSKNSILSRQLRNSILRHKEEFGFYYIPLVVKHECNEYVKYAILANKKF